MKKKEKKIYLILADLTLSIDIRRCGMTNIVGLDFILNNKNVRFAKKQRKKFPPNS